MAGRRRRSFFWIFLAFLVLAGGAAFFSLRALSRTPAKLDPDKLVRAVRADLARSVVATGKIEPTTKVEIKSKASGIILKLPVNVGDAVHQGQVICELDQNDILPRIRQSEAALGFAEATLKSAQAEYERNKVEAEGPDVPFLKRDLDRTRELLLDKLTPRSARDEAEKNYEMARNRQQQARSTWVFPRPPLRRPRLKWSRRARNWPRPRRTCATPPSLPQLTASCSRATGRSAMLSVLF